MTKDGASLEWSAEAFREAGHRVVDLIADHYASVREKPVRPVPQEAPEAVRERFLAPMPEAGESAAAALEALRETRLLDAGFGPHPRYVGWVPNSGHPMGVLGDALTAALNVNAAVWDISPEAAAMELQVLDWVKDLAGYPREAAGVLGTGGSDANLTCLAAALQDMPRTDAVWYTSTEGHFCIEKAARILGLPEGTVRKVPVDGDYRLDVAALEEAVLEDRAAGRVPAVVAATAGTINTGAIDPLGAVADLCEREGLWFHVDGAYGAFGRLAQPERYAGMERADSLALDAHKWLYTPLDMGVALVREREPLDRAFGARGDYILKEEGSPKVDFYDRTPQLSRRLRALTLWLMLRHFGREGLAARVAEDMRLAQRLAEGIDALPEWEVVAPVTLTAVNFRLHPDGVEGEALDALNRRVLDAVWAESRSLPSSTTLDGRFVLRACVTSHRSTEADMDAIVEDLERAGASLRSELAT